jgi:hypothetical protein
MARGPEPIVRTSTSDSQQCGESGREGRKGIRKRGATIPCNSGSKEWKRSKKYGIIVEENIKKASKKYGIIVEENIKKAARERPDEPPTNRIQ